MFKLKFLATLFIVGLATRVSSATPPACILACVNEEKSVSDIKAVCAAESAQECLADSCDSGDYSTARTYFENICKTGGYEVAKAVSATASGTAKPTASSGASSTLALPRVPAIALSAILLYTLA
ncbi:hypothetical protein BZA05DRAFT_385281 [Tricharina praecox]|uniref:uncharacterized protein n=1 Tax=Tricharina praecox TaxID=43433 RepID=UPI002220C20B|nr:uncharacterized protein BZA05DRAFT_413234 [Tricharina praecox]XP_051343672.1 uncharacterized protein BZA05DRAFT_385281 [Tricharina praecox]KAI5841300.1 hypothetical protein BZA05DRAFT_413234 [Tricharina praecox]KAI5857926.1 hypothetical protein BZA05DRAFT_385281 [Tricharina praecox]